MKKNPWKFKINLILNYIILDLQSQSQPPSQPPQAPAASNSGNVPQPQGDAGKDEGKKDEGKKEEGNKDNEGKKKDKDDDENIFSWTRIKLLDFYFFLNK